MSNEKDSQDRLELKKMLVLRKQLDPDAPDAIVFVDSVARELLMPDREIDYILESRRLADAVVDAAIEWHTSGIDNMEQCFDKAGILGSAIDELIEFRRKASIVKPR